MCIRMPACFHSSAIDASSRRRDHALWRKKKWFLILITPNLYIVLDLIEWKLFRLASAHCLNWSAQCTLQLHTTRTTTPFACSQWKQAISSWFSSWFSIFDFVFLAGNAKKMKTSEGRPSHSLTILLMFSWFCDYYESTIFAGRIFEQLYSTRKMRLLANLHKYFTHGNISRRRFQFRWADASVQCSLVHLAEWLTWNVTWQVKLKCGAIVWLCVV